MIGVGSFCRVQQVHIKNHDGLEDKELALKCLRTKIKEKDQNGMTTAANDLKMEGELLSTLHHPNIIKLHGVGGSSSSSQCNDYFLVMDLLADTLNHRLEMYRVHSNRRRRSNSFLSSAFLHSSFDDKPSSSTAAAMSERVETIALGVARGLAHLHSQNIVWRDLKPDNIGFDNEGTPKIFDLGFSRKIQDVQDGEIAGTLRYLAPEVVTEGGYQTSSDVYSFGILLWELCTLEKPFEKFKTAKDFMDNVVWRNYRPHLSGIQSGILRDLIEECWDTNPALRPPMSKVVKVLQLYVIDPNQSHPDSRTNREERASSSRGSGRMGMNKKRVKANSMLLLKSSLSQSFSGPFELDKSPASHSTKKSFLEELRGLSPFKHRASGRGPTDLPHIKNYLLHINFRNYDEYRSKITNSCSHFGAQTNKWLKEKLVPQL